MVQIATGAVRRTVLHPRMSTRFAVFVRQALEKGAPLHRYRSGIVLVGCQQLLGESKV
jgi:hypothetical protein